MRWALDHKRIAHRRRSLYPGWHALPTLAVSRQVQVPMLRVDARTICDSTRILEWLEQRHPHSPLYPDDPALRTRARALEEAFDRIGPSVRRVHYSLLVPHVDAACAFFASTDRGLAFHLYRPTFRRFFQPMMGKRMHFEPERVEASRRELHALLARFDDEIQPSGYLVGDAFGVADLTVASLLSTLLFPPQYPYPLAVPFPEPVLEFRRSLEHYAALDWVREIYAKHRPSSAETR